MQKKLQEAELDRSLLDLYGAGIPFLADYPWEWESDRWGELITTFFSVGVGLDPDVARRCVGTLEELGLTSVAGLSQATAEQCDFLLRVLIQQGATAEQASEAVIGLIRLATRLEAKWGGYIQRFLRRHGEQMVDELKAEFVDLGVKAPAAAKIAVLWLQNVANLPVLLPDDPHIRRFRERFQLSEGQLLETADRLGINVSVLDDLLALEARAETENRRPGKSPRSLRAARPSMKARRRRAR